MPKLHALTEGELEIFKRYKETGNPNVFTSFYLRGESTGTWWNPGAINERWSKGYDTLRAIWISKGKPGRFEYGKAGQERSYRVIPDEDPEYPRFHDHHGFLFQPWQLDLFKAEQRIRVVVGGFGCGKTYAGIASMLVKAATLPGYRGLVLAPNSTMTGEVHQQAERIMYGTRYAERFLIKSTERPFPKLVIGNDHVGESMIQFFPIGDSVGVKKILTLTIDECLIDQSEQLDNIREVVRAVGSRMRGDYNGRVLESKMTFLANADENDELWDLYDETQTDPDRVWSISPRTWDNPFITDEQIEAIKKDVGGDEESIRVHMEGGRPITGGEHFSQETLALCKSDLLDDLMRKAVEDNLEGHVYNKADKIGVWEWALPPEKNRKYLVVADPGYDNPPRRNSAVIMVFDYTDFPEGPAQIRAFYWVFGNNSPWPWIDKFIHCVQTYDAFWSNAIDDTGMQSYYTRVIAELQAVNANGLSLTRATKMGYLNLAKSMAAKGLFKFPSISRLFRQLSRYRLPDDNLDQDIVMTLLLAAGWLESVFYTSKEPAQIRKTYAQNDRLYREPEGFHKGTNRYYRSDPR